MKHQFGLLEFNPYVFGLELFFTLIIIFSSYYIFSKTKSFYQLTEHKGIKYFRKGFLFISLAHVVLLLNILFRINLFYFESINPRFIFGFFGLFYFIGIGYLFSSMYSKKIKENYIFTITILVFLLGFYFQTKTFMFIYSAILIISLGLISISRLKKSRNKKKKLFSQIYIIYILIFLSWLINFLSKVFISLDLRGRVVNVVITGLIFLYISYLVIKKLK